MQSFTESTLTSPRVARWGGVRVSKSVTDKYKIWLKGGCFTCLILIGTIAIVLTVLPILSESTLKVEINEVGLGQLFDLLEAFFCVYSSPEKLLAPQSQKVEGLVLAGGGWHIVSCKKIQSSHGRLFP